MTPTQKIRQQIYCADCKNCKLQVWNKGRKMEKLDGRGYINQLDDEEILYIVRCGWTKDNVFAPDRLNNCEGKQKKRQEDE